MLRRLAPARNPRLSSGRGFSSNFPPTQRPRSGGSGNSIVALLATAVTVAAPVLYIKTQNVQIDSRLENVVGLLFGTEAVLFLRPTEGSSAITSYPSLYDLGSSLTVSNLFGKKAEDALTDDEIAEILLGGVDSSSDVDAASSSTSADNVDGNDQQNSEIYVQDDLLGSPESNKNSDSRNIQKNSEYSAESNSKQIAQDSAQQNTEKGAQHDTEKGAQHNSGNNTQQSDYQSSKLSSENSAHSNSDISEKQTVQNTQNSTENKGNESGSNHSSTESGSAVSSVVSNAEEVEEVPLVCPFPPRKAAASSVSVGSGSSASSVSVGPGSSGKAAPTDSKSAKSVTSDRVPESVQVPAISDNAAVVDMIEEISGKALALRKELELTLLKDIDTLDESALRARIALLSDEFVSRTKWENLRLSQSAKQVEVEVANKYLQLMLQQRSDLDFEFKNELYKKEQEILASKIKESENVKKEFQAHLTESLENQKKEAEAFLKQELASQAKAVEAQLQDELNHQVAVLRESHVKEMLEVQEKIEKVQSHLQVFNTVANDNGKLSNNSVFLHKQSAAILALEEMFKSSKPFKENYEKVKELATENNDALVLAVLESFPKTLPSTGALTISDLKIRFAIVKNAARQEGYVPAEMDSFLGSAVGYAFASVLPPSRGYVPGDSFDCVLSRTQYLLDNGLLLEAVKELDGMTGYGRILMSDWIKLAEDRVRVDQSAKVLRASSVIRHASFAKAI